MSRPETIDDLDEWQRQARPFIKVDPQFLTTDVAVGAALLNLIAACRASVVLEVSEDGEFKVEMPLTQEEIEGKIATAQRAWDHRQAAYNKAQSGEQIDHYLHSSVDEWAKGEGLPPVEWARLGKVGVA